MTDCTLYRIAGLVAVDHKGKFVGFVTLPQQSGNPEDLRLDLETLIIPTGYHPYGKCFRAAEGPE